MNVVCERFFEPSRHERKRVSILGLMDERNASVTSMRVFRKMNYPNATNLKFRLDNDWWQTGEPLEKTADLLVILDSILHSKPK